MGYTKELWMKALEERSAVEWQRYLDEQDRAAQERAAYEQQRAQRAQAVDNTNNNRPQGQGQQHGTDGKSR